MKLSEILTKWAKENGVHDSAKEPIDWTDPCHCDFCQKFIPMAIKQEQEIEKLKNHVDAVMMGVYIV